VTTAARQVAELVRFRWSATAGRTRAVALVAVVVLVVALPVLCAAAVASAHRLPAQAATQVVELVGAAHLLLVLGLLTAAVASSGGRELVPRAHLVAYPVAPATEHLSALLLAPLNLAWWAQVGGLALVTASAVGVQADRAEGGALAWTAAAAALALTAAWAIAVTALGQLTTWAIELVRTLRGGRWWLRGSVLAAVVLGALAIDAGALIDLLDSAPSRFLQDRVLAPVAGSSGGTLATAAALLVVAAVLVVAGAGLRGVLELRPNRDQSRQETHRHTSRPLPARGPVTGLRAWRRTDWRSVLRSPPLRRGLLVLLLVPLAGGLVARVGTTDVVLLTAVVAAGGGLLFGVNAFCLDGEGAVWRESLPDPPRTWLVARGLVLTELVLVTTVPASAATLFGATGRITPTVVTAIAVGTLALTGQVVARCLRWSVTSPHRAELRTSRDSPAPPGRMASCSAQLAGPTVLLAIVLATTARTSQPWLPVLVCVPSLVLTVLSLRRTARRWDDPAVRSAVVQAVSRG
jgi:hypothetical protein